MKFLNFSGVYQIKNTITGDFYIGSAQDIETRFRTHKGVLKNRKHINSKLQENFNLYGESSFEFTFICKCDVSLLEYLEQQYINSMIPALNIKKTVTPPPMRGKEHSMSTKSRTKGRQTWNKGLPRTEEELLYMSYRRKQTASKISAEQKIANRIRTTEYLKQAKPFKGKSHTESMKKDIRNFRINGRRKIKCHQNGKIYAAQNDIHKELGIKQGHISENLSGKRASVKGYTFEYIDEVNEVETTFIADKSTYSPLRVIMRKRRKEANKLLDVFNNEDTEE